MRYDIDITCKTCGESCAGVPVSVVNGFPMVVRSVCERGCPPAVFNVSDGKALHERDRTLVTLSGAIAV